MKPIKPGGQSSLVDGAEAIKRTGHFIKFGAHPGDGLQYIGMLGTEILPMYDALMVEDAVPQIANPFPTGIQLLEVALRAGGMRKGQGGEGVAQAGAGVGFVEEASPKSEVQLGH